MQNFVTSGPHNAGPAGPSTPGHPQYGTAAFKRSRPVQGGGPAWLGLWFHTGASGGLRPPDLPLKQIKWSTAGWLLVARPPSPCIRTSGSYGTLELRKPSNESKKTTTLVQQKRRNFTNRGRQRFCVAGRPAVKQTGGPQQKKQKAQAKQTSPQ